jgi:hypothetical protein
VQATVVEQLESRIYDVKKPKRLCNPVEKDGEPLVQPLAHLLCYQVKAARGEPKHVKQTGVGVANQFGSETLETRKEEELCVPALKIPPEP